VEEYLDTILENLVVAGRGEGKGKGTGRMATGGNVPKNIKREVKVKIEDGATQDSGEATKGTRKRKRRIDDVAWAEGVPKSGHAETKHTGDQGMEETRAKKRRVENVEMPSKTEDAGLDRKIEAVELVTAMPNMDDASDVRRTDGLTGVEKRLIMLWEQLGK